MSWSPEQYLRFDGHRLRPVIDLIARIDHPGPSRVIDLGCGPGNATMLLRERWPDCALTGLDNDPEMLTRARRDYPAETWIEGDIAAWAAADEGERWEIVFTNAALQWLGGHETLFPNAMGRVAPDGVFACQMPHNFSAPSHVLLRETMHEPQWADRLAAYARWEPVADPDVYYDLLRPRAAALDIWEIEYLQVLEGENAVLEWVKGTALTPVREALPAVEYAEFTARYGAKLREAYPRRADGTTLLPFRRLFIVARANR